MHAPGGEEHALDTGGRGGCGEVLLGHLSELGEAVLVVLPPVEQDDVGVLERHRQVLLELVHLGLRLVVGGRALLEDATQGYLR